MTVMKLKSYSLSLFLFPSLWQVFVPQLLLPFLTEAVDDLFGTGIALDCMIVEHPKGQIR